jgi:anti-anti-sigma factor
VLGDVDMSTVASLRATLESLESDVVVDLAELNFIDSAGLGVLAMQRRRLEAAGSTLRLTNPTDSIAHLLRVSGLEFWLDAGAPDD